MARRNRPILYEVFGSEQRIKGTRNQAPRAKRKTGRKGARTVASLTKEIRVSYELAAVIALLAVVLGGTLYYFGWVRGNDPDPETLSLASQSSSSPAGEGSRPNEGPRVRPPGPKAQTETFYSVRVWTACYDPDAPASKRKYKEDLARAVKARLVERNLPDVRAAVFPGRGEIRVYVGRASTKSALEPVRELVACVSYKGKREFKDAYVEETTVKK